MDSKKLTMNQIGAIYRAGYTAYHSSYAMMIDDIMTGIQPIARKYGLDPCYDSPWFRDMASLIKYGKLWSSIPEKRKEQIQSSIIRCASSY